MWEYINHVIDCDAINVQINKYLGSTRTPESPLRGMSSENAPNIRINFWPILVILIRISQVT